MKVGAFTILEMVITLLLMSMIISMVYVIFDHMSKNTRDYMNLTQEDVGLQQFQSLLRKDVYDADKLTSTGPNKFSVIFYNGSNINYQHSGDYLFRIKDEQRDSILVKEIVLGFVKGQEEIEKSIISRISINATLFGKDIPLYVFKDYYSRIW
ncbi:MAG: PulJ/GspJ family protein [Patiriisocius sp.]|uniref:PulJ/GspJ family protein n=1 Tax=Patiriisocius sp. TaxID=2822396 RepID=UPI003EF3977C